MNAIDKIYYPVIRTYIKFHYLGGGDTCSAIYDYIISKDQDIQEKIFKRMSSEKVKLTYKDFHKKGKEERIGLFKAWEDFLKYGVKNFRALPVILFAFEVPGFSIEERKGIDRLYLIGYYYSSFNFKLKKCLLTIFENYEVSLSYIEHNNIDERYEGVITEDLRSIDLSKINSLGENKYSKIILAANPSKYEGVLGMWQKEHEPDEFSRYQAMTYIFFESIRDEVEAINHSISSAKNKLLEVAGWRFDKKPISINERNVEKYNSKSNLDNLEGCYELYHILSDPEESKDFSLLKIEITENLEIILNGTQPWGNKNGSLRLHPNGRTLLLEFTPSANNDLQQDFMRIIIPLGKGRMPLKGTISQTCNGVPFCGVAYLVKVASDIDVKPRRMSIEEVHNHFENETNFIDFLNFFLDNNTILSFKKYSMLNEYKNTIEN